MATQKPPSRHDRPIGRGEARDAILQATLHVVAEEGIDAVTHRKVAAIAGVSPGSTTHHFASREDLLREAFRFYLQKADEFMRDIDEAVQVYPGGPVSRVEDFLCELIDREFAQSKLVRAEYELLLFASTDPELAADVRVWEGRSVAVIAGILEAAGASRPVEAARTVLNLVRGFELERLLDPRRDAADFRRRIGPFLKAICAPDPAPSISRSKGRLR